MRIRKAKNQRFGSLSMEWILLITLAAVGIIGGLGVVRNAVIKKLYDLQQAVFFTNDDLDLPASLEDEHEPDIRHPHRER